MTHRSIGELLGWHSLGGRLMKVDPASGAVLGSITLAGHFFHRGPSGDIWVGALNGTVVRLTNDRIELDRRGGAGSVTFKVGAQILTYGATWDEALAVVRSLDDAGYSLHLGPRPPLLHRRQPVPGLLRGLDDAVGMGAGHDPGTARLAGRGQHVPQPGVVAKMAVTIDHVSHGRLIRVSAPATSHSRTRPTASIPGGTWASGWTGSRNRSRSSSAPRRRGGHPPLREVPVREGPARSAPGPGADPGRHRHRRRETGAQARRRLRRHLAVVRAVRRRGDVPPQDEVLRAHADAEGRDATTIERMLGAKLILRSIQTRRSASPRSSSRSTDGDRRFGTSFGRPPRTAPPTGWSSLSRPAPIRSARRSAGRTIARPRAPDRRGRAGVNARITGVIGVPGLDLVMAGGSSSTGPARPVVGRTWASLVDGSSPSAIFRQQPSTEWIDATDRVVAPGWVDLHSHSDITLLSDGRAVSKVAQGVTTEVNGNCGMGSVPLPPAVADARARGQRHDRPRPDGALGVDGPRGLRPGPP